MTQHYRKTIRTLAGPIAVALLLGVAGRPSAQAPAPVAATPENAAAFLGDWSLSAQGQNGPAVFTLLVKNDAGKVVAEISSEQLPKQAITDITKAGPALVLRYAFDYQGNAVAAAVTLTPADGKVAAFLDFANGAYQMDGVATKKDAPK